MGKVSHLWRLDVRWPKTPLQANAHKKSHCLNAAMAFKPKKGSIYFNLKC